MASRISLIFTSFFLTLTVLLFPRWEKQFTEAPIAWDVSGYYSYLPALFIYDDIKKLNWLPGIVEKYKPSHNIDQAFPAENENMVFKYPAGMSILYSPFFFAAHSYALASDFPADGFSLPYQIAIQLGGLIAAIIGLIFLQKILIRYFSDYTTAWVVLLIGLGTNFFNYATFDSGNVHVWSFALLSILTYLTILFHEKQKWKYAIGIGTCIGLSALVRPTEILFFLIPLLWAIGDKKSISGKIVLIKNHFPRILVAIIIVASIGFIQLIYWKSVSGDWIVYSYEDQGFSFDKPHFMNVFFSYRKGWFIYTPLMFFAAFGFIFSYKKWKEKDAPYIASILFSLLINTWIVASWDIWWYGGAFGQRALISSYALLAFPLALLIEWTKKTNGLKWIFSIIFIGCISLNLFQTYQAHWGPWEASAMNKAYYWRIFGKIKNKPNDKLLLDLNYIPPANWTPTEKILFNDFEKKDSTVFAFSGISCAYLSSEQKEIKIASYSNLEKIKNQEWLRLSAQCFSPDFVPHGWHMPGVLIKFQEGNNIERQYLIRPHRVLAWHKEWKKIEVDLKVPSGSFDTLNIFLWNQNGAANLYLDDLKISL